MFHNSDSGKSLAPKKGSTKLGIAVVVIFLLIIIGICSESDDPKSVKDMAKAEQPEEKANSTTYLFVSPDAFQKAFNQYTTNNNLGLRIGKPKVQNGEVQNTFTQTINKNLAVMGSVNKSNGSVKEILMIGSGDGTFKSGADIFICIGSLIAVVDPELDADQRADIMKELGFLGDGGTDVLNLATKTTRNGIKYSVNSSQQMGVMFSISHQ